MDDLIGNNYEQSEDQLKAKKLMKLVGIILIILLVICIALVGVIYYIQATQLKVIVDKVENKKIGNMFIFENNKLYIPIRRFAQYMEYESSNGNYQQDKYTEDTTKCYVKNSSEAATFTLGSNKIYKTLLDNNKDYEYYELEEPIKMINDELCTTIEGARIAFNISMAYNTKTNTVTIYTLPYLVKRYTQKFQNSGIADDKAIFSNKKALLYNMIIVKNEEENYGVWDLDGKEIIGTKYTSINFIESTREFIVTTPENKMGIIAYDATTKISPQYDNIKQIDKDAGLYLATNNTKQGVINNSGSTIVYLDYDQIGIDVAKYNKNANIKNQYLLYDNCIPVKKNGKWGMFDKNGRQILPLEYDDFGCTVGEGNSKITNTTENNVLLIPKYDGIVVKKDNLYGLVDKNGKELVPIVLKSIYSTTSSGEETYHMLYGDQERNLSNYVDARLKAEQEKAINQNNNTVNNTINNTNTTNQQTNTAQPNNYEQTDVNNAQ